MKEMNLREAGDTHHGKRGTETLRAEAYHRERKIKNKEVVRQEAKRIAQILPTLDMNRIHPRERQAFLRIKEKGYK